MIGETITLKAVLAWIDAGAPFSIAFVTNDDKRNTGGEWVELKDTFKSEFITKEEQAKLEKAQPQLACKKDPSHYENSTRNIVLKNGEIRKIHIRLIRRFNGKTVL